MDISSAFHSRAIVMNIFKKGKSDNNRFDGIQSEEVGINVDYIQLWDDTTEGWCRTRIRTETAIR